MRTSRFWLIAALMAVAFCLAPRQARADGETATISGCSACNGYSFNAQITQTGTNTYQVVYTITNNSGAAATPYNWSVTAFDNGDAISSESGLSVQGSNGVNYSSDYQVLTGKTNNGNGSCNGSISSAFCVNQTGGTGLPVLNPGDSLTFTFDVTCTGCSLMSSWDFLGSGNPAGSTTGNVYAITNWGNATSMPEPSIVALYLSTLAVGLVFAWYKRGVRNSS